MFLDRYKNNDLPKTLPRFSLCRIINHRCWLRNQPCGYLVVGIREGEEERVERMRLKAKEIAKELGVSEATVSLALNDRPGINKETKQKILTYIR